MSVTKLETKVEFDTALADAGDKLVMVDFYATWCGPCNMIAPKIKEMAAEFTQVLFYKVDVDINDETAEAAEVQAMPTFIFYKNGAKVDTVVGANETKLREVIEQRK